MMTRNWQFKKNVMIINIPSDQGLVIVNTETIIRIEALNNYSRIIFDNRKPLVVAKVLRWFEDRLPPDMFSRIHKSHLVNCSFIGKINGSWSCSNVLLHNGETISVSRRKRGILKRNDLQGLIQKAA
jgi:two-component system LytT family response regulator